MRFIKKIYYGEGTLKKRFAIIRKLKAGKFMMGVYVVCPSTNSSNLLDIIPSFMLLNEDQRKDLLVLGIASSKSEAFEVCRDIVMDVYNKTSGYDIRTYYDYS